MSGPVTSVARVEDVENFLKDPVFGVRSNAFGICAVSAQLEPRHISWVSSVPSDECRGSKLNQSTTASLSIVSTLQFNVIPSFDSTHVERFSL